MCLELRLGIALERRAIPRATISTSGRSNRRGGDGFGCLRTIRCWHARQSGEVDLEAHVEARALLEVRVGVVLASTMFSPRSAKEPATLAMRPGWSRAATGNVAW
jgi:hypothetical protein